MKTHGIAVLGCGAIAQTHLRAIRETERARVVGVFSRTPERAREVGEREGCAWTTDYRELLRRPEAEIIAVTTSSGSHGPIAQEALEAGKHVLVEKPLAMTSEHAALLVRCAAERKRILAVVSQRRFEEQHQAVRRVLDEGRLGRLLLVEISCPYRRTQEYYDSVDWRGTRAGDGGALMNQGIHSADLMLWLAGPARSVFGRTATQTHRMEAEDLALALVDFESGAFGTVMASTSVQPGFQPTLNLYGEKGTIRMEGIAINHWIVPGVPSPEFGTRVPAVTGDPRSTHSRYHAFQYRDLLTALEEARPPAITGEDGLRAVRFVEAVYRSSSTGRPVQL